MRSVPAWGAVAAATSLVATGCGEAGDGEGTVDVPDVPTFEGTIDLEIGRLDGDDPYLFSRIADVDSGVPTPVTSA